MKKTLLSGIPPIALGLLLTVTVHWILPVCPVRHGMQPMRCYWSGSILTGFGGLFMVLGIFRLVVRSMRLRTMLAAATVALAVLAVLVPTWLVGMCGSAMMPCRTGTLPAVCMVLALIGVEALVAVFYARHGKMDGEHVGDEATHDLAYSRKQL